MRPASITNIFTPLLLIGLALFQVACQPVSSSEADLTNQPLPKEVDFNFHIRPILADRCYKCHGPDGNTREANLRFDIKEAAFALLDTIENRYAIVPGNLKRSELAHRISSTDPEIMMPPPESNLSLSAYEIALLKKWIKQGAEWKSHWAFIPPTSPEPPEVSDPSWPQTTIDYFVMERLDRLGWEAMPQENKAKLIRRLSFDVRGLPPTQTRSMLFSPIHPLKLMNNW